MLIEVPFIVYQHLFHRSITSLSLFNDISFIVLWVIFHRFAGSISSFCASTPIVL